jgi:hypothetical protein
MLKKIIFTFFILYLAIYYSKAQQMNQIDNIKVYKSFLKGGTTNELYNALKHPEKYKSIDTSMDVNVSKEKLDTLRQLFSSSNKRKQHQQKIGGVEFAGEAIVNHEKHIFIFCTGDVLIDLTAWKRYSFK